MEFLLQSLLKGTNHFLQVLGQAENFSDFETGILLGIVQNPGSNFLFLKVLRKVWDARKDLQGVIFKKFLIVFFEAVQSLDKEGLVNLMEDLVNGLEFIGCCGEGAELDLVNKCFLGSKKLFVGKVEMVKLLGVGEFDDVGQGLINKEQAKIIGRILDRNVDEAEVSEGCKELETLGKKLEGKANQALYDIFIGILVYLCEVKARFSHVSEIENIIHRHQGLIKEADRKRVFSAFDQLCKRVNFNRNKPVKKSENEVKDESLLETQILESIEKASNYFFTNNFLDCIQLNKDLKKLNHNHSPNLLYKIVSDMIFYDEPSAINFKYWSQFLEALKTLPNISKSNFSELQELTSRLSKSHYSEAQKHSSRQSNKPIPYPAQKKPTVANQTPIPSKPSSIQAEYQSLAVYHSQLSESALSLIKDHSATASILEEINEATKQLRLYLKSYSPSCTLKFIGSAVIGTYIKDSSIDILVQDALKPPSTYIVSLGSVTWKPDSCFLLTLPKSKYTFCAHTENLLQIETSALIKKYCQIDARINELLLFVKIWAKNWNLTALSGFHWTIITLVFIINTEPSLVPNLQHKKHTEKLINGFDTWFDSEYSQVSPNYWSLGELIFHFFHFFSENLEFVADLKTGKFLEGTGQKLVALHPFTGQSISQPLGSENEKLIENAFKATFELLVKSEPILNILNFH